MLARGASCALRPALRRRDHRIERIYIKLHAHRLRPRGCAYAYAHALLSAWRRAGIRKREIMENGISRYGRCWGEKSRLAGTCIILLPGKAVRWVHGVDIHQRRKGGGGGGGNINQVGRISVRMISISVCCWRALLPYRWHIALSAFLMLLA